MAPQIYYFTRSSARVSQPSSDPRTMILALAYSNAVYLVRSPDILPSFISAERLPEPHGSTRIYTGRVLLCLSEFRGRWENNDRTVRCTTLNVVYSYFHALTTQSQCT